MQRILPIQSSRDSCGCRINRKFTTFAYFILTVFRESGSANGLVLPSRRKPVKFYWVFAK
jgi:hypothetical protein